MSYESKNSTLLDAKYEEIKGRLGKQSFLEQKKIRDWFFAQQEKCRHSQSEVVVEEEFYSGSYDTYERKVMRCKICGLELKTEVKYWEKKNEIE